LVDKLAVEHLSSRTIASITGISPGYLQISINRKDAEIKQAADGKPKKAPLLFNVVNSGHIWETKRRMVGSGLLLL
jgi:hypothetical protein